MLEAFQALFGLLKGQFSTRYLVTFAFATLLFEGTQIISRYIPAWVLSAKGDSNLEFKVFAAFVLFFIVQTAIDVRIDT